MKTILAVSLFAVGVFSFAGCAPPATNTSNVNTNSNTNAAPKAAAPTADALLAMDNKAFEAWKNKDAKFFEGFLADNFVGFGDDGKRQNRAEAIKMITEHKCDIKSFSLTEPHVTPVGADAAVLTYKATSEGTCEGQKLNSPVIAASVYVRSGDTWKAAYHNEVAIIEPKADANTNTAAASDAAGSEKKSEPAPAAKSDTASNSSMASNANAKSAASNSNTAGSGDALTDALMAVERKGWEAWMKQDTTAMQSVTTNDVTFVDAMGKVAKGSGAAMKVWMDGSCKVSSVDVSDGKATMITKDAAILTYKGTAVGTCGPAKLEPLWGTTVAVKEGDVWKAVYIFETPMRKS